MNGATAILAFLLATHAAAHALFVHAPERVGRMALIFGICAALGSLIAPLVSAALRETPFGRRVVLAWPALGGLLFVGLFASASVIDVFLTDWVLGLLWLVGFLLLVQGADPHAVGLHQGVLGLLCAAVLAGGEIAVSAAAGYAGLAVAHLALRFQLEEGARLGAALRRMLALAIPATLAPIALSGLWGAPEPHRAVLELAQVRGESGQIVQLYAELIPLVVMLVVLMSIAIVTIRLFTQTQEEERAPEVAVATGKPDAGEAEDASEADGADPGGPRGQLVRVYLRVSSRLARLGHRRPPAQTPAHFAGDRGPALRRLTQLFMDARYGPREPERAQLDEARGLVPEVLRESTR